MKKTFFFIIVFIILLGIGYGLFTLPHFWDLKKQRPNRTAFMKARGGHIEKNWVPLSQIAPSLRLAVIAAEDQYFYGHRGVDWDEVKASFQKNIKEFRFARGASTISMQLTKNLYLSSNKTLFRKFQEVLYTYALEYYLSKNRILEIYLNIVEWGPGVYGADAAAHYHFKIKANQLTVEQSAYLAALLPNPRALAKPKHREWLEKRTHWILNAMQKIY